MFAKIFVIVISLIICASSVNAQSGEYVIFLNEKKAMTESFELEKAADGLLRLTSQIGDSKIVTVAKPSQPQSFSIVRQNTKTLSVDFQSGTAKISMVGQTEKSIPTRANVVLENNVWSEYILLLAGYDSAKAGKQNFNFFLPSLELEFPLSLQKIANRNIALGEKNLTVEDYELDSEATGLKIKITADANKIPLLIEIAAQQVKVVRKDFEADREKLGFNPKKIFNAEFSSEDVTFPNGEITLGGTLTVPKNGKKSFPAAIIISGSGGQDRDGSNTADLYKIIAESLTKAGIAVLRVDDRGVGKSAITKEQAETTSYSDLIGDTRAAIDFLAKRPEIDRTKIMLVGHSEGVGTALSLAVNDRRAAAVALLAGTSDSLDKTVVEQSLYQAAKGETVDVANRKNPQIVEYLMKMFAAAKLPENADNPKLAYFREHLNFNPLALAEKTKCPVLILQGERDSQVLAYHAVRLATSLRQAGNKNVSLRILPDSGHLFNSAENTKVSETMLYDLQVWADKTLKP